MCKNGKLLSYKIKKDINIKSPKSIKLFRNVDMTWKLFTCIYSSPPCSIKLHYSFRWCVSSPGHWVAGTIFQWGLGEFSFSFWSFSYFPTRTRGIAAILLIVEAIWVGAFSLLRCSFPCLHFSPLFGLGPRGHPFYYAK